MPCIKFFILAVLLIIFAQDVRSRSVSWFLFPVLMMLFIGMHLLTHPLFAETWHAVLINIAFLIVQFLIVSVYFSIKSKHWVNITNGLLGWGDMLFLVSVAFYFSVLNFLFFYITSLIVSLLAWVFWQAISKEKNKQIPLAGFQALLFVLFLATGWWIKSIDLTSDTWLLNFIMK